MVQQARMGQAAAGRDLAQRRAAVAGLAEHRRGLVQDVLPRSAALRVSPRAMPKYLPTGWDSSTVDAMAILHVRPDRTLRRARVATSAIFAVHGAVVGTFAARVPWVADHVGTGPGGLGVALLMPGVGALLAMPLSGRLAHRFDLRILIRVLIVCCCAALLLPALPDLAAAALRGAGDLRRHGRPRRRGDERARRAGRGALRAVGDVRLPRLVERRRPGRLGGRRARRPGRAGRPAALRSHHGRFDPGAPARFDVAAAAPSRAVGWTSRRRSRCRPARCCRSA